jgi:hypothetical protein
MDGHRDCGGGGGGHLRRIGTGTVGRNRPKAWGRQGDQARPGSGRGGRRAAWERSRGTIPARGGTGAGAGAPLRDCPGASRGGGTVPARAQGQLWAPISEELRDS